MNAKDVFIKVIKMRPINAVCIGFSIILFSLAMLVGIEGILLSLLDKPEEYGNVCCALWFIAVVSLAAGVD